MGIQSAYTLLKEKEITVIDGQITSEDFATLYSELSQLAYIIPTTLGGGEHGHSGLVLSEREYTAKTNGVKFVRPKNPGRVPATLSDDEKTRAQELRLHEASLQEYLTCIGVEMALREKISKAVPKEWLAGIQDKTTGLSHLTIHDILAFVKSQGVKPKPVDVTTLHGELIKPWTVEESPATYFQRGDNYEEQLEEAGIAKDHTLRLQLMLGALDNSGEYDLELAEWERKATKTFAAFRVFIQEKWAAKNSKNRSNTRTVKYGIANVAREQAPATQAVQSEEELVAELLNAVRSEQDKKMEQFFTETQTALTATTKALEAITLKLANGGGGGGGGGPPGGKPKPKKCPHCNKFHFKHPECWELPANAAKRPANWKSVKESS
jgi:hypothetical protein